MGRVVCRMALAVFLLMGITGCSLLLSGETKLQQGDYSGAEADFTAYLREHPDSFTARYLLGRTYLEAKRADKAVSALQEALELKPEHPEALIYLGLAYVARGEEDRAIRTLEAVHDPGRPELNRAVQKQLTLLKITRSRKLAQKALAAEKQLATVPPERDTYAVCYFEDQTPDGRLGAFQKALAAMTISNLSQIRSIQVVERLRLQALLEEMALGQTGVVDPATAPRAGRLLGAENLIVGELSQDIRADTVLASTSRQKMIGSAGMTVDREYFFELPGAIAANIARMKNLVLTPEEREAIGYTHTRSFSAVLYYGQALDALDAADWEEALAFFDKALEADPDFQLARRGRNSCPVGIDLRGIMIMSPWQMQQSMSSSISRSTTTRSSTRVTPVTPTVVVHTHHHTH